MFKKSTLSVLLVCVCSFMSFSQTDMRPFIIKIETEGNIISGTQKELGAGFVIGKEENNLFVATAYHVVEGKNDVNLMFRNAQNLPLKAELINYNRELDFAVLQVTANDQTARTLLGFASESVSDDQEVKVIGHPNGNLWDVNTQNKIKTTAINLDQRYFTITQLGIKPGHSGGVVLDIHDRLLGIILETDNLRSKCLSINAIINQCQDWGIPVLIKPRKINRPGLKLTRHIAGSTVGAGIIVSSALRYGALQNFQKCLFLENRDGCVLYYDVYSQHKDPFDNVYPYSYEGASLERADVYETAQKKFRNEQIIVGAAGVIILVLTWSDLIFPSSGKSKSNPTPEITRGWRFSPEPLHQVGYGNWTNTAGWGMTLAVSID